MAQASTRGDAGWALLATGLVSLLGFLVLTTAVSQRHLDGVDLVARSMIHQSRHPGLHGFMDGASYLGGQPGQVAIVVIGSVMLLPRRRRWALALPLVMLGVGLVQFLAKWAVDRPRPNLDPWGFPSAHVLSLVVLCGYLAYVACLASPRRRWQGFAVAAGVGIVGTVGYSRMYLDAHWLSDVVGGLTAGLAYLLAAIWLIHAAPRLGPLLRAIPRPAVADGLLVPAPAGPAPDPLIAAAAVGAMTPATPTADPG
jgi:membrane-associated phospholipid phosphatase